MADEHHISMQDEPYSEPTKTGIVKFTPPGSSAQYETFYSIYGDLKSGKTPLIGLHGGPGSTSVGLTMLGWLTRQYDIHVVIYDQIGCGQSTHLRDRQGDTDFWTYDLFIAELRNLLAALEISTYDLLGTSWGGMLSAKVAIEQPSGLRKLVLATTPPVIEWMNEGMRAYRDQLAPESKEALNQGEASGDRDTPEYKAALLEFVRLATCRAWPFPPALSKVLAATREQDKTVYSTLYGPSILQQTGPLKDFDIRPDLHLITPSTVPGGVLVLLGRYDPCSEPEGTGPFQTMIKADVKAVMFEESAHVVIMEETEKFIRVVSDFLLN